MTSAEPILTKLAVSQQHYAQIFHELIFSKLENVQQSFVYISNKQIFTILVVAQQHYAQIFPDPMSTKLAVAQ
jgi:hypothetical protein